MAQRPLFIPDKNAARVFETIVDFKWVPGMARSQAQKCIRSLHESARKQLGVTSILEISSKSEDSDGIALSAFNLRIDIDGTKRPLECVYQSSKKFRHGGPYFDLIEASPRDAKRDERLKNSGPLISFMYGEVHWELNPKTAYYDWLYIQALANNPDLAACVCQADAFTDIAFNPAKSLSCQARSAALFSVLDASGLLKEALASQDSFLNLHSQLLCLNDSGHTLFR